MVILAFPTSFSPRNDHLSEPGTFDIFLNYIEISSNLEGPSPSPLWQEFVILIAKNYQLHVILSNKAALWLPEENIVLFMSQGSA